MVDDRQTAETKMPRRGRRGTESQGMLRRAEEARRRGRIRGHQRQCRLHANLDGDDSGLAAAYA